MSKTPIINKGGRPRVDSEAISLRLHRDMIDAVDSFRASQEDNPSRPEAIRRGMAEWLAEKGYLPKPPQD